MRKFIKFGGRKFDNSEEFILNQAMPINNFHEEFFNSNGEKHSANILVIKRDSMDFLDQKDFANIIKLIK